MTIHQVFATVCSLILFTLSGVMIAKSAELNEPIQPLKLKQDLNLEKVNLGRSLFNDKRLSRDNSISCASCHDINKGGVDQLPVSKGVGGALGTINTPTVLNSSLNFRQFWDGRAVSLEEQIDGPIHLKNEMNSDWPTILTKLQQDQAYVELFKKLYKNGLQAENIKDAISEYERSLITPSRFDRYLLGQKDAINENEIKGYELFKRYGCVACHQGVNIGGNMYQLFGVMGDYFKDRGNITAADLGHFNVSKDERDRHKFKVPSLRNVALTAPYFHDGSAKTLRDAVRIMAKYQLGRSMPEKDEELIIQFLQSLSGELPVQAKGEQ
ncbi:MAG: cytochrome-c peroxidase [Candidatus Competibacteraceae bacterium]|nr:cytochrome-c peroxidase [Candidatus Competibacteraceae bacterium]